MCSSVCRALVSSSSSSSGVRAPKERKATKRSWGSRRSRPRLEPSFGPGYVVLGPAVAALVDASQSARAALAGFAVARAWAQRTPPVEADDLLPERALAGDPLAKQTLIERIFRPLQAHSTDLVTTLWSYLDNGRSLEATARELFVHPNTVRYRLKRVSEVIGWDATGPREALILQTALILGCHRHGGAGAATSPASATAALIPGRSVRHTQGFLAIL